MAEKAVLIIDVQNAIIPEVERNAENRIAFNAVLARIGTLLEHARAQDVPVIYVQHSGSAGHRLERGSKGWRIRKEIAPAEGEPIVHKSACDSFFETTLSAELESRKITVLIVAGCMTEYCIDTSVRRAVSLGYDVTLVADGHMTSDSGTLKFSQVIAHHNAVLDGLDAGDHSVRVLPLSKVLSEILGH